MFRLIYMTFYGQPRYDSHTASHVHESPKVMTMPLVVLAVLSVIGGYIGLPESLGGGAWFEKFLSPVFAKGAEIGKLAEAGEQSHSLEYGLMAASVALVLVMIMTARRYYQNKSANSEQFERGFGFAHTLLYNKYYVDELYDAIIVRPLVTFSNFLWQSFDVLIVDGAINGAAWLLGQAAAVLRRVQTGMVRSYAFIFLMGAVFVIGYLLWIGK
jgi:NADH-quinone oxidoreductase subunit L